MPGRLLRLVPQSLMGLADWPVRYLALDDVTGAARNDLPVFGRLGASPITCASATAKPRTDVAGLFPDESTITRQSSALPLELNHK
jgi:hypothetical protein